MNPLVRLIGWAAVLAVAQFLLVVGALLGVVAGVLWLLKAFGVLK